MRDFCTLTQHCKHRKNMICSFFLLLHVFPCFFLYLSGYLNQLCCVSLFGVGSFNRLASFSLLCTAAKLLAHFTHIISVERGFLPLSQQDDIILCDITAVCSVPCASVNLSDCSAEYLSELIQFLFKHISLSYYHFSHFSLFSSGVLSWFRQGNMLVYGFVLAMYECVDCIHINVDICLWASLSWILLFSHLLLFVWLLMHCRCLGTIIINLYCVFWLHKFNW